MREADKDRGRIEHMLEMAINLSEAKQLHSIEEIRQDKILFYGLTKMVEIIGEAAYMLTHEFKETNKELPWRQITGMRHILVHGYNTVTPEAIWEVIQNDIPTMIPILKNYLNIE